MCSSDLDGKYHAEIFVDKEQWETLNHLQREVLVYHELGHCILDYNHICDRMAIMNPAINFYPIELYQQMWDRLVEDFFDKNRGIQCPELRITENQVEPELVLPNIQICPH